MSEKICKNCIHWSQFPQSWSKVPTGSCFVQKVISGAAHTCEKFKGAGNE